LTARVAASAVLRSPKRPALEWRENAVQFRPQLNSLTPDRCVIGLLVVEGFVFVSHGVCFFPFNQHKGWTVLITTATVAAVLALIFLWYVGAMLLRSRFQFSVSSLLLLTVVVALPLGWIAREEEQARKQRASVEAIGKLGGIAEYDYEIGVPGGFEYLQPPSQPAWLRRALGNDFFNSVVVACPRTDTGIQQLNGFPALRKLFLGDPYERSDTITDRALGRLPLLTQLQVLTLDRTQVTDAGLTQLEGLRQLQWLSLHHTRVTDRGLQRLVGLSELRGLDLGGTQVTDAGLECLKSLPHLQWLSLHGTRVTDRALDDLKNLTNLESLSLCRTRVTDAGLSRLAGLTSLQALYLRDTRVTDAGLRYLRGLTNLRELGIDGTRVTGAGLTNLAGLTELQVLYIPDASATDAGLRHLLGLTHLRLLAVNNAHATYALTAQLPIVIPNSEVVPAFPQSKWRDRGTFRGPARWHH
jgi:hypothetical protein